MAVVEECKSAVGQIADGLEALDRYGFNVLSDVELELLAAGAELLAAYFETLRLERLEWRLTHGADVRWDDEEFERWRSSK